jgi:ABC-type uncharacterized transport system substrate-binding protein
MSSRNRREFLVLIGTGLAAGLNGCAFVVSADSLFAAESPDAPLVRAPEVARVPTVHSQVEPAIDAGGLMAYSPNFAVSQRRAAAYVDKILKGVQVGDLPVEQAMTFELGINLRTAQGLGIDIPQSGLLQATRVVR